jgi:hypothetical protein
MKALTWHGVHDERVDTVADPAIQQPTDVTWRSTPVCAPLKRS